MNKIVGRCAIGVFILALTAAAGPAAALQDTPNLALNKPVRASSAIDQSSFSPDMAVDGIRTERSGARGWSSDGDSSVNHIEWIYVDLTTNYDIGRVDLYPRNAGMREGESFPVDFTIQVSLDSFSWKTVVTRTGYPKPGTEAQKFTFDKVPARYVKIEGTNLRYLPAESGYWMVLAEIEIYEAPKDNVIIVEPPKTDFVPSSWGGEIVIAGSPTQQISINIKTDNSIAGQIIQPRTTGTSVRHDVTGTYNPETKALTMSYATKSGVSITQGTLTGKIDSADQASGTITVKVSLTQITRTVSTTGGTWKLRRF
jgi:hypothetical protein